MEIEDVYASIGEEPIVRLVAAFYAQVPTDPILGPMYPEAEMEAAEQRLRGFLIFRFGGPQHYIEQRGHPRLRMRHVPFHIDEQARDRWVELMRNAMDETAFPSQAREPVFQFLSQVATSMVNASSK